jgi:hypothetical protein
MQKFERQRYAFYTEKQDERKEFLGQEKTKVILQELLYLCSF